MADEEIALNKRLYDDLQMYVKNTKLIDPKFHITEGTNKGDNYVGLIYRVTIEGIENGETKNIKLILKTTRTSNSLLPSTRITKMFQREIFFYREILPIFEKTLKEHGEIVYRSLFPTLYYTNDEPGKEVLLLENLTQQGFVMKNSKILDYSHATLALQCLGEFHAYSFITRLANPTDFNKLKQMEEPVFFPQSHNDDGDIVKNLSNIVIKALIDEDRHYSERVQQFLDNTQQNMIDATDGKAAEPYAVVNHGDTWTNNMLFRYDQEGKTLCDLRFLDLQLCRYASPVLDIVYILFCCCTQETRSKHYNQLVNEYYETLSKCLERFGYDSNTLFPYEILFQHFTRFGKYAAGMALYVLHLFTSNDSDIQTAYNTSVLEERLKNDNFYRNMIKGTFKDLVDKNYI